MPSLPRPFFLRDARLLAPDLLGRILVRAFPDGTELRGRIVETEAYLGPHDLACHTARGPKDGRARSMWLPGGHAYIYFTYGMHHCFNVVCGETPSGQAALIRAVEPLGDLAPWRARRAKARRDTDLAAGPARLCQALDLDRTLDGHDLTLGDRLWIEAGEPAPASRVRAAPRVGVDYAGAWAKRKLRFLVKDSPWASRA